MSRRGLGRGIDALFDDDGAEAGTEQADGLKMVPIDLLAANPDQPRKHFDTDTLEEMADSIRRKGVLQPLIVQPAENGGYEIVAGERRYRAAKLAGVTTLPVLIRTFSEAEKLEVALIENIQRENLDPIEEAEAYLHLVETFGNTHEEVAERVGKSRSAVANSLRLLNLPISVREAVSGGAVSAGHARALLPLVPTPAKLERLYHAIVRDGLSVRAVEEIVRAVEQGHELDDVIATHQAPSGKRPRGRRSSAQGGGSDEHRLVDPDLQSVEDELLRFLGTKVKINGDRKKGTITIHYYTADDLDRLVSFFLGGDT